MIFLYYEQIKILKYLLTSFSCSHSKLCAHVDDWWWRNISSSVIYGVKRTSNELSEQGLIKQDYSIDGEVVHCITFMGLWACHEMKIIRSDIWNRVD